MARDRDETQATAVRGAILCAVASVLTDLSWPLFAAVFPVTVMILNLPRGGAP